MRRNVQLAAGGVEFRLNCNVGEDIALRASSARGTTRC